MPSPEVIIIDFPDDEDTLVYFSNRRVNDLPISITRRVVWVEHLATSQDSYAYELQGKWYPIEYINHQWYHIFWNEIRRVFVANKNNLIQKPHEVHLGTEALPYSIREQETRTEEPSQERQSLEESTSDTPVIPAEQSQKFDQLAEQLDQLKIASMSTAVVVQNITTQQPQAGPAPPDSPGGGGGGGGWGGGH